jgi:ATP-dependent Lon protease
VASPLPGGGAPSHLLLPVLPLRDVCLFPEASLTVGIDRLGVFEAAELAERSGRQLLAAAQIDPSAILPGRTGIHDVGTLAELVSFTRDSKTEGRVELNGLRRARVVTLVGTHTLVAEVEPLDEGDAGDEWGPAVEALARYIHAHSELKDFLDSQQVSNEPMAWVNRACQHVPITATARQKLLDANALERCLKISRGLDALLRKEQES